MEQIKQTRLDLAREKILLDSQASFFVNNIGLLSFELGRYLRSNNMAIPQLSYNSKENSYIFPNKNFEAMAENLIGENKRYAATMRYPGSRLYYSKDLEESMPNCAQYIRIIYEANDSLVRSVPIRMLFHTARLDKEGKELYVAAIRNKDNKKYAKALDNLKLAKFDGRFLSLTDESRKIFYPERQDIFDKLRRWQYRIDVWK